MKQTRRAATLAMQKATKCTTVVTARQERRRQTGRRSGGQAGSYKQTLLHLKGDATTGLARAKTGQDDKQAENRCPPRSTTRKQSTCQRKIGHEPSPGPAYPQGMPSSSIRGRKRSARDGSWVRPDEIQSSRYFLLRFALVQGREGDDYAARVRRREHALRGPRREHAS